MKAQPQLIYAQIEGDRVHWIFTAEQLPEWNDDQLPAIDVTGITPSPKAGDYYREGAFFPDPGPAPDEYHVLDPATYTWQPLDAATVDALKTSAAERDLDAKVLRTIFEVIFQLTNDVRTLKGQEAITRAQLRDQMIVFYKTL